MSETYYAIDTNFLLDNPMVVHEERVLLMPSITRELQKLEKQGNNRYRAREVNRQLVGVERNPFYKISDEEVDNKILKGYDSTYADNRFIAEVQLFAEENKNDEVVVVTGDLGMTTILQMLGIRVQPSLSMEGIEEKDRGIHNHYYGNGSPEEDNILATEIEERGHADNQWKQSPFNPFDMARNEYLLLWDRDRPTYKTDYRTNEKVVSGYTSTGVYRYNGHHLERLEYNQRIKNQYNDIEPINTRQRAAFDLMEQENIPVKLLTGPPGSGKTWILVNSALEGIEQGLYKQILWVRNPIDLEDTKDIGALPGDKDEKLLQYAMPIADIIGGTEALYHLLYLDAEHEDTYGKEPSLVIGNLNAIRGRSFDDTAIIVTETQNLTPNQVKVLVGRVGKNSVIMFDGDVAQGDTTKFKGYNGIRSLQNNLRYEPLFGEVTLDLVERSDVAKLVELL